MRNLYGETLEPCREREDDTHGSWDPQKGTCNADHIHSVCVRRLPDDFCRLTGQEDRDGASWCSNRKERPHCICQGAYAMYANRAPRGPPLQCRAIPWYVLRQLESQSNTWRPDFAASARTMRRTLEDLHQQCVESEINVDKDRRDVLGRKICKVYASFIHDDKTDGAWYQSNCKKEARSSPGRMRRRRRRRRREMAVSPADRRLAAWPPRV